MQCLRTGMVPMRHPPTHYYARSAGENPLRELKLLAGGYGVAALACPTRLAREAGTDLRTRQVMGMRSESLSPRRDAVSNSTLAPSTSQRRFTIESPIPLPEEDLATGVCGNSSPGRGSAIGRSSRRAAAASTSRACLRNRVHSHPRYSAD